MKILFCLISLQDHQYFTFIWHQCLIVIWNLPNFFLFRAADMAIRPSRVLCSTSKKETGEIRYRLFFDCAGFDTLPFSYLERYLSIPLLLLHHYGDAVFSVAHGTSTAEAALAQAKANEA
jgi:hypothetical protein